METFMMQSGAFNLPVDVEERLMAECYAEALEAADGSHLCADTLVELLRQKATDYWRSVNLTIH